MAITKYGSLTNWWSQGIVTNPVAGTLLADSDVIPLDANASRFRVCISSVPAVFVSLEWYDVDGANVETLVQSIPYAVPASSTFCDDVIIRNLSGNRTRLRIKTINGPISGSMQGTIQWQ